MFIIAYKAEQIIDYLPQVRYNGSYDSSVGPLVVVRCWLEGSCAAFS